MKTKALGCLLMALVAVVLGGACLLVYWEAIEGKSALTVSELARLNTSLHTYYNENNHWPKTLRYYYREEPNEIPSDPFSRRPYLYTPDGVKPGDKAILIAQPEPFRTAPWPFGEMRRYGLLGNGEIHTFRGQRAITFEKNPADVR